MEIRMGRFRQSVGWCVLCVSSLAGGAHPTAAVAAAQGPAAVGKPVIALVDGTVVAVDGGAAREKAVVLIEGDRISQVGSAGTVTVPAGAKTISMKGKWLI